MNFKLESKFTTYYLKKEFEKWKWWAFKIPDLIRTIKPFDFFWVNEKWVFFCEVKMIDWDIFKFSDLRNNQYTALKRIYLLVEKYNIKNVFTKVLIYSKKYNDYINLDFSEILKIEKEWLDFIILKKIKP